MSFGALAGTVGPGQASSARARPNPHHTTEFTNAASVAARRKPRPARRTVDSCSPTLTALLQIFLSIKMSVTAKCTSVNDRRDGCRFSVERVEFGEIPSWAHRLASRLGTQPSLSHRTGSWPNVASSTSRGKPERRSVLDLAAFRPGGDDREQENGAIEDRLGPERRAEQVHSVEADRKQDDRDHDSRNIVIAGPIGRDA